MLLYLVYNFPRLVCDFLNQLQIDMELPECQRRYPEIAMISNLSSNGLSKSNQRVLISNDGGKVLTVLGGRME